MLIERDKRVGTSKNLRQATGDEVKVTNKTIDGLQSVSSDSNDKLKVWQPCWMTQTNVIQYGDDDFM